LTLWLTFHLVIYFSTAYSKIAWSAGPLYANIGKKTLSPFTWQQYR